jgi:hypothetical protein
LVLNLLRIPICIVMASMYGTLESIWWGVVAAETIGALYGGIFGFYSIHKLVTGGYPKYPLPERSPDNSLVREKEKCFPEGCGRSSDILPVLS